MLCERVLEREGVIKAERVFSFFRVIEDPSLRTTRETIAVLAETFGPQEDVEAILELVKEARLHNAAKPK
jgi:hypothetical protein